LATDSCKWSRMDNIINLLPNHIANQIAAGEVVQRPASVVKELLENAIDAAADHIQLIVKDSGKTLIQIIDNGKGMTEADAQMCFERHATSKISSAEDIFSIVTKGFRGEALASIAAVAHVELKTRMPHTDLGISLKIEGSELKKIEPTTCPQGSSFSVKNIFYNTPARRNFLKSDAIEFKHIIDEFTRVALVHNEIAFRLIHNDKTLYQLPKANLRKRLVDYFGEKLNDKLVPIAEETAIVKLGGFVLKPTAAKKQRGDQFLFVNRRFIKSNYLQHAIAKAFEGILQHGYHAGYFVYLELDPKSIDINIHPTKTEIKFRDEKAIYAFLISTVKRAIGIFNVDASIDFDQDALLDINHTEKTEGYIPGVHINTNYNPFNSHAKSVPGYKGGSVLKPNSSPENLQSLLQIQKEFEIDLSEEYPEKPALDQANSEKLSQTDLTFAETTREKELNSPNFIQVNNAYIVSTLKSGLIIIDQERAHERILYEEFLEALKSNAPATQSELFPERFSFSTADYLILQENIQTLEKLGLSLSPFGQNEMVVNGIPNGLKISNLQAYLERFIEELKNFATPSETEMQENVAKSMAKISGIKKGQNLNNAEMGVIFNKLFATTNPTYTPTGKLVIVTFTSDEIRSKF